MTPASRLWNKVDTSSAAGCWNWTGARNERGYGRFFFNGRNARAHRVSYMIVRGPIPEGMVLDHLCRNPSCINPNHLEPVTLRENALRGEVKFNAVRFYAAQTHCKHGHEWTPENTLRKRTRGHRICKICRRAEIDRHNARRAAK